MTSKNTICRVCGYDYTNYYKTFKNPPSKDLNFYPWGENGDWPKYDYCSCCSVEFGNGDDSLDVIRLTRKEWIDAGMPWDYLRFKTSLWYRLFRKVVPGYDPIKQMKNIPKEFL